MITISLIYTIILFTQVDCNDNIDCTEDIYSNGRCINNLITGYCLIDNICYKTYDTSQDGCGICLPQKDPYKWSNNKNDELECTEDKIDENGNCLHILKKGFCLIDHRCIPDKVEDNNGCKICDISKSVFDWTYYSEGTICNDGLNCTKDDRCNGNGECKGIEYSCNDEIDCTLDICDGQGGCYFKLKNDYCYINGECILDTSPKKDNPCMYCNVLFNQNNWTYEANGKKCDDNNSSTPYDYCDGKGNCKGYTQDPFEDAITILNDTVEDLVQPDSDSRFNIEREGCSCQLVQ